MGHVRMDFRLANPEHRDRWVDANGALEDTGATFTVIPRRIADELGLETVRIRTIRTAEGRQSLRESYALLTSKDAESVTPLLISETLDFVLVGGITLEALGLAVDPVKGELRESEVYLL